MTSQKNLQQLTMEKEQALADLNSVERSLSDLFRRYENLKGVLEGFKKVLIPVFSPSLWLWGALLPPCPVQICCGIRAARCALPQCRWLYFVFQNEEALKKCAQDYLNRVKQEEQRYQALKVHAEEKLDK